MPYIRNSTIFLSKTSFINIFDEFSSSGKEIEFYSMLLEC